jgi:cobalamin synthase
VALGVAVAVLGWPGLLLAAAAGGGALALAAFLARRFEGIGGDACGAIIEVTETVWLLAGGALLHHGLAASFRPWEPL